MPRPSALRVCPVIAMLLCHSVAAWARGAVLFRDDFSRLRDGLVTNEYAHFNPQDTGAARSGDWDMDSGSLFIDAGDGWTGVPDDVAPDVSSSNGNNSAVFRLTTRRQDFKDVAVGFWLRNQGLYETRSTPAKDWDGLHVFLRYQSEYHLYYASINRRDNTVIVKKKVPGGPSNGGTYYDLCLPQRYAVPYHAWQDVKVTVRNDPGGTVSIEVFIDGKRIASATDDGLFGGPPIRAAGRVGLRGDNADLKFDRFTVTALGGAGSAPFAGALPGRRR